MLRYAAAAVTSLVLITGLSACGAGDPPAAQPKPTRTATTPSASPSPTPPTMPAAARANTKAGAEAFVRHYVSVFNYAEHSGDTQGLRALEGRGCKSCRSVRRKIDGIYNAGGHVSGGTWVIRSMQTLHQPGHGWEVDVLGHFKPSTVYPGGSAAPRHAQGGKAPSSFFVSFKHEWRVAEWTRGL